jgi:alginate lyase
MPCSRRMASVVAGVFATAAMMILPAPMALGATKGIWLTPAEIRSLPTSGPAWENVKRTADSNLSGLTLMSDQTSVHDTATLAVALVWVRLGDNKYRAKAAQEIDRAIGSENGPLSAGSRHLPIGRNAPSYVIAADLIDLASYNPALDARFRTWIRQLRDTPYDGESPVRLIQEERSNNHGTMAGSARAAISAYLGDTAELARTAQVLRGWMGDRSSFTWPDSNFHDGSETFMADPAQPRPVNPVGVKVAGHDLDGAQPQELSRCGLFEWPPCHTIYAWGGLAGSVVTAEILRRQGYSDIFQWENQAILRAYQWLDRMTKIDKWWWNEAINGDDSWQPWLANFAYAQHFPAVSPSAPGRNMGWTDWTHAGRTLDQPIPGEPRPGLGGDHTPPVLRRLTVSPRRVLPFRRGRPIVSARRGTRISYVLSEPATVRFTVGRARHGHRVRARGAFKIAGHAGANRFRFTGRLRGHRLRRGRYRLTAVPRDGAGNRGRAVRLKFRVRR